MSGLTGVCQQDSRGYSVCFVGPGLTELPDCGALLFFGPVSDGVLQINLLYTLTELINGITGKPPTRKLSNFDRFSLSNQLKHALSKQDVIHSLCIVFFESTC